MTASSQILSKHYVQFYAASFVGLGISRVAFPAHCRGCQCERVDKPESSEVDGKVLPDRSPDTTPRAWGLKFEDNIIERVEDSSFEVSPDGEGASLEAGNA